MNLTSGPWANNPLPQYATFAALPAANTVPTGYQANITGLGSNGTILVSNGTRWLPLNGSAILKGLAAAVSAPGGAAETIALQFTFPAGLLKQYDRIVVRSGVSKAGTTTTGTIGFRFGTLGTTGDTQIATWTILPAASRSVGAISEFRVESDTTVRFHGTQAATGTNAGIAAAPIAAGLAAAVTVSGMTANAMILTMTVTPGATDATAIEDAEIVWEVAG